MVIEFLTFRVPPSDLDDWLNSDAEHWTSFLQRQDGFVRKEIWRSADEPDVVHAVIWWESMEQWHQIPPADLDAVGAAMGEHERHAECIAFDRLRTT